MPEPAVTLEGKQVILRSTREEDLPELTALWNNGEVMRWVGFPNGLGYTHEKALKWLDWYSKEPGRYHFCARTRIGEFLGELACHLDIPNRRAGLDIKFVPEAHGRGLSREAFLTLIDWVFRTLPEADAVWTEPRNGNLAAQTLYYSCGLRPKHRPPGMQEADSYWERVRQDAPPPSAG